jgi:protein gp37
LKAEWVRALRDRCVDDDVAFFFKQWGGRTPKAGGRELDGRTWDEMPRVGEAAQSSLSVLSMAAAVSTASP